MTESDARPRCGRRARYAVRDWAAYDRALSRRGAIAIWIAPDGVAGWHAPAGRQTFSGAAIAAALTVRAVFRSALRQAEGLAASALLGLALPAPDRTTLSRRGRTLRLDRRAGAGSGTGLAIGSTGPRLARPRGAGREGWRKLHIGVDPDGGRVLAEEPTRSGVRDARPVPTMLGWTGGRIGRVHDDGAYAGGLTHRAVAERRQAPPDAEGVFRPKAPDVRRAAALDRSSGRGGTRSARLARWAPAWGRATGHGRRDAAEWAFSRLKRLFGGGWCGRAAPTHGTSRRGSRCAR